MNNDYVVSKSWHISLNFLEKRIRLGIFLNTLDLESFDTVVHLGHSFVFTFFILLIFNFNEM